MIQQEKRSRGHESYQSIETSDFEKIFELCKVSPYARLHFEVFTQGMRDLGVVRWGHLGAVVTIPDWLNAKRWMMSSEKDWSGSFEYLCELFEINPQFMRTRVINMQCHVCGGMIFQKFCRCRWKKYENSGSAR